MFHRIRAEGLPISEADAGEPPPRVGANTRACRFDGFEYDFRRAELRGRDAATVALRPKADALLRLFLGQPGRLFTKDELIAAVWPAAVVTDDSLVQCVGELRSALDDHAQRLIRTLPRRGYRFDAAVAPVADAPIAVVMAPSASLAPSATATPDATPATIASPARGLRLRRPSTWIGLGLAVAALVAGAALSLRPAAAPINIDEAITARGTVAVLRFVADPETPALRGAGDAVADEIVAQFATRIGMRGVGRAATAAFDPATPPLARIASTLKASHIITGRVTPVGAGDRLAIDVQLVRLANGEVIWSRHYERTEANTVQMPTEIGLHVVNAVRHGGSKSAIDRTHEPGDRPDAVDLTLQASRDLDRRQSIEDVWRARSRLQAALRDDPRSVIATNLLAQTYSMERADPTQRMTAKQIAEHERLVELARSMAPNDATALLSWGQMQIMRGRPDLALPALEKANRLVPSYPAGHLLIAEAQLMLGRPDEVQARVERSVELSPNEPRRTSRAYALGAEAALMRGDNETARDLAQRGIAALPSNAHAHATLAAVDALDGRSEDAVTALAAFLKLWPDATVARYDDLRRSTHPLWIAQRERLYEGLRKAGLPQR